MVLRIAINIASGNGSLSDSTNQFPESMLTYHHQGPIKFRSSISKYSSLNVYGYFLEILEIGLHLEIRRISWDLDNKNSFHHYHHFLRLE